MEVGALDVFFNRTTSKIQMMHENIPWRGAVRPNPPPLSVLVRVMVLRITCILLKLVVA